MSAIYEEEYQDKKVELGTWKKLLSYAGRYKKQLRILIFSMMSLALTDVAFPLMRSYVIDNYIVPRDSSGIIWFSLLYLLLLVYSAVVVYIFILSAGKIEVGVSHDIRRDGFDKLQQLSFSYYDKTPVGYIMARMTSDTVRLGETIAWSLVDLLWGACFMVFSLIAMLIVDWKLALIVIAIVPPLALISVYFRKRILKYQREVRKNNSRITGAFSEGIMGARTTKTLVREELNYNDFAKLTGAMRKASVKAALFSAIYMPLVMTLGSIATGVLLWKGGENVLNEVMMLGKLNFFISLAAMFFEPIYQAARIFAELQSSQAAAERVIKLVESEPDIIDRPEIIREFGDVFNPKHQNWPRIKGEVEFENVSFQYKEGEKVLDSFSLKVGAGQTIALVGETGSGKSTIVNLICRFYEPTEGRILVDGQDYRDRSQLWLHANLGYVLQTPHLFSGTIKENIRYGKLEATDEEVERAAKLVDAHSFITKLPNGYDTEVGEGGSRLSTGEKQLLSFARAILADPALFVLDEATSSIDTETEYRIQTATEKLLESRTSFIIAHRLSTIRHADRILVIDDGKVIEEGTHHELMRRREHYYELYTNQFRQEAENRLLGLNTAAPEKA